jgi:hypothetical protein
LTDDELILFDALFDTADRLGMLRRERFADHNLPYTHDFDDKELERAVRRLGNTGLVRIRPAVDRPDLGPWVDLTVAGGTLWEIERLPDWARFCRTSSEPDARSGRWELSIVATEEPVVDDFSETALACGLYAFEPGDMRRRLRRSRLVAWLAERRVVEARVPLAPESNAGGRVDWGLYEAQRTWWRTVPELATLVC